MDKVEQIHKILSLLITPGKVKQSDLARSLKENMRTTLDALSSPEFFWLKNLINELSLEGPANDPCWDFTSLCLRTLICLSDTLIALRIDSAQKSEADPRLSPAVDILGAKQQIDIRATLHFVACLGIGRNLMRGVGVPLHSRTRFSHFLEDISCSSVISTNSEYEKHCMLYATVCSLHSCCKNSTLSSLILTKHLNDFLAALCQLCFAPLNKGSLIPGGGEIISPTGTSVEPSISDQQRTLIAQIMKANTDRTHCLAILTDVIGRTLRSIVVQELLRLQGVAKTSDCLVPAPNWLRKATQNLLNEVMVSKLGLLAVIQGILDKGGPGTVESQNSEWQTCNVIAKLIANRLTTSDSTCQTNISEQFFKLLDMDKNPVQRHLPMVLSGAISFTVSIQPEIAEKYLLQPLFRPLILYAKNQVYSGVEPGELTKCILNLHKIFVVGKCPNSDILNNMTPTFGLLFYIQTFLSQTISSLRMPVEELLCGYLNHIETSRAVDQLVEVVFAYGEENVSTTLTWNASLELALDDEAGLLIQEIENPTRQELNWLETDSRIVSSMLAVLSRLHNEGIVAKLFLRLVKDLSSLVGSDSSCAQSVDLHDQKSLLNIESATTQRENRIRHSLLILQLLSSLCDNADLQKSIIKDNEQTFQFLNATLERGAVLCSSNPEDLEPMEAETLTMAMAIITLMLAAETGENNRKLARASVPHLQTLKSRHSSESVRHMAEELIMAIATKKKDSQKHLRRDELSQFQQAWEDVFDHEVPIRGHALLALAKLISASDKETMDHCEQLFVAFQENMKHQDSYVYLMAVQGLAALAGTFPDKVIPILTEEFCNMGTQQLDVETRMKFGEVLVKVTRILGEMVPKYRERLLNAFLVTCRDADPFVRSSSLSNLGEACKELRYALGSNVHEIFNCLSSYVRNDSSIHVRRAAAQVIVLLLRGLGTDALKALEEILKDLYALIKHVYRTDKDNVVKLHAQLALEELQVICRDFLFPKVTLEKRITII